MSELRALAKRTAAAGHINHKYNYESYVEGHLEKVALTSHSIAYKEKIVDETILDILYCASMLHDYLEDCFDYSTTTIIDEYHVLVESFGKPVANTVLILSRNFHKTTEDYFKSISENLITKIIKTADRLTNILCLHEVQVTKKRKKLFDKYSAELEFFEKYDIYPGLIKRALHESQKLISR